MLADRAEALVYLLAHERRHMHQKHGYAVHPSFPVGRVKNARGAAIRGVRDSQAAGAESHT